MPQNVPGPNNASPSLRNNLITAIAADLAVAGGQAEFIAADPATVPRFLQPVQAGQRAYCRLFSQTGTDEVIIGGYADALCTPYLEPDQRPVLNAGDPSIPPGGQCPFFYSIDAQQSGNFPGSPQVFQTAELGPIGAPQSRPSNQGSGNDWFYTANDGQGGRKEVGLSINSPPDRVFTFTGYSPLNSGDVDNCGDQPGSQPGYGPAPNPLPDPPGGNDYEPPEGGPNVTINVGSPMVNVDGTINIPVEVDGIEINIGSGFNGPEEPDNSPLLPDPDSPGPTLQPGPGGGDGGGDNPPDGIESDLPAAVVVVTLTQTAQNIDEEAGGPSRTFGDSERGSAGWFKWRYAGGTTFPIRLQGIVNTFTFSRGPCVEADGFEVKFSAGNSGFAVAFPCESSETEEPPAMM